MVPVFWTVLELAAMTNWFLPVPSITESLTNAVLASPIVPAPRIVLLMLLS